MQIVNKTSKKEKATVMNKAAARVAAAQENLPAILQAIKTRSKATTRVSTSKRRKARRINEARNPVMTNTRSKKRRHQTVGRSPRA